MEDTYTDMAAWVAENQAFLAKVSQVEETKTTKSKKEEN